MYGILGNSLFHILVPFLDDHMKQFGVLIISLLLVVLALALAFMPLMGDAATAGDKHPLHVLFKTPGHKPIHYAYSCTTYLRTYKWYHVPIHIEAKDIIWK